MCSNESPREKRLLITLARQQTLLAFVKNRRAAVAAGTVVLQLAVAGQAFKLLGEPSGTLSLSIAFYAVILLSLICGVGCLLLHKFENAYELRNARINSLYRSLEMYGGVFFGWHDEAQQIEIPPDIDLNQDLFGTLRKSSYALHLTLVVGLVLFAVSGLTKTSASASLLETIAELSCIETAMAILGFLASLFTFCLAAWPNHNPARSARKSGSPV